MISPPPEITNTASSNKMRRGYKKEGTPKTENHKAVEM